MGPNPDAEKAPSGTGSLSRGSPDRRRRPRPLFRNPYVWFTVVLALCLAGYQGFFWVASPFLRNHASPHPDAESPFSPQPVPGHEPGQLLLGVGKADITGPVVEVNMMGYADPLQIGSGLRQRLYSRAFIVAESDDVRHRFVYLVLDIQSGDTAIRYGILSGLKEMGPEYAAYGHDQLAVTGTHSHAGPGAFLNYRLPQLSSKGFSHQSYRAIVDDALLSIRRAHQSLQPGSLVHGSTKVPRAGINRSVFSYMANPPEERARYNISAEEDGTVDQEMTMLKFSRQSDGRSIGALTWFPTHGTSMLGNQTIISGDNKGVAADLLEKKLRKEMSTASDDFVASFSQANMGDVSPNVLGAWCEDESAGECNFKDSTCSNDRSQACHARGPRFRDDSDGSASCFEIGRRQYEGALRLYEELEREPEVVRSANGSAQDVRVRAVHGFHNMAGFEFSLPDGRTGKTCPAALGYSFAAGTTDGPGVFDFAQHRSNASNTYRIWKLVGGFLKVPGQEQIDCQHPKPILLDVGEAHTPYEWTPTIVDVQTLRVGQFVIVVSPGEATTMAGRRWREAVQKRSRELLANELGDLDPVVVLGGPANTYTHYITTEEEYSIQRFEGASTLYGPHTLARHINRSIESVTHLTATSDTLLRTRGPMPPDHSKRSFSFIAGVVYDTAPWSRNFGDVKTGPSQEVYNRGGRVATTFVAANPRNNLRLEGTYALVQRLSEAGTWETVRDDSDWGVIFRWRRTSEILGTREATVEWEVESWTEPGTYRLGYYGDAKSLMGKMTPFEGVSESFRVVE